MKNLILLCLLIGSVSVNAQTCFKRNRIKDHKTETVSRQTIDVCYYENTQQISMLDVFFDITDKRKDEEGNVWIMTINPNNAYVMFGFELENSYIHVYSEEINISYTLIK